MCFLGVIKVLFWYPYFDLLEQSTLISISLILFRILSVDTSKISMYISGGVTLEFLFIKSRDEVMSTDSLSRQEEL